MELLQKVEEMTPEQVKNIDLNKIEYIALSSGEIIYIKKQGEENQKEPPKEEEELKEIPPNENEEIEENINNEKEEEKQPEIKNENKET